MSATFILNSAPIQACKPLNPCSHGHFGRAQFDAAVAMLEKEADISGIADTINLSRQTVYRIRVMRELTLRHR